MKKTTQKDSGWGWRVEDDDDIPANSSAAPDIYALLESRLTRRGFIVGAVGSAAILHGGCARVHDHLAAPDLASSKAHGPSTLRFEEIRHGSDDRLHVARGHSTQTLLRWGDPILPGAPAFDPRAQTAKAQATQFGYNCDYTAYLPLEGDKRGLLVVNHEHTNPAMMFPGAPKGIDQSPEQIAVNMMAHGLSVVEVRFERGQWRVVRDSKYNRRITPKTRMTLSGPAAGHPRVTTKGSPDGRTVYGTMANCAGGVTPWGTIITAEENIQYSFLNAQSTSPESSNHERMGIVPSEWLKTAGTQWGRIDPSFDLEETPKGPNHFGWMVEIDPYDPQSVPRKRTALGRFKHEGCGLHVNVDGRVVAYMGDDQRFEYIYRFVSADRFKPGKRSANARILDEGTLSVARFDDEGKVHWLPLVHGQGPLTAAKGFASQAEVLIETRRAADLLGATPMDRPEDVEVNPRTKTVFVMLTNNSKRTETNSPNPRLKNVWGQIIELKPPGQDHSAQTYSWDFLLLAGDPKNPDHAARYHPETSADGWFAAPDNCTFDPRGRLWIATDGSDDFGFSDGLWACDVEGPGRALTRHFLRAPVGAELTGPCFTTDGTSLFCSIQHPGTGRKTSYEKPSCRWPDFDPKMPPRPSVVVVRREDGKEIT